MITTRPNTRDTNTPTPHDTACSSSREIINNANNGDNNDEHPDDINHGGDYYGSYYYGSSDSSSSSSSSSSSDSSSSEIAHHLIMPTTRSPITNIPATDAVYDDMFVARRQAYVASLYPTDRRAIKSIDNKSSRCYKDLYKIGEKVKVLSLYNNHNKRAKQYRNYKTEIHHVLLQNRYTKEIKDCYGCINLLSW